MAVLTQDFEAGVNGASVTTGDTGSLSTFNSVTIGGGGLVRYSTAQAAKGSKSLQYVGAASSGAGNIGMSGMGSLTDWYGRFYIYFGKLPAVTTNGLRCYTAAPVYSCGVVINPDLTLSLIDINFINVLTSTAIILGKWARIEFRFTHGVGSTCSGELRVYQNIDSLIPKYSGTVSSVSFGTSADLMTYSINDIGPTYVDYLDQLVMGSTVPVGPFPAISSVPVVHGTFSVGSTVTCDGGTWGDLATAGYYQGVQYYTLTYQWKRDGSNIVGQTSRTYTLQSADLGHYIQCQVTATGVQFANEIASALSAGVLVGSNSLTNLANYIQ